MLHHRLFLAIPLLLAGPALAQDDPAAAEAVDVGDTVFALQDAPSTRFPDADDEGPTFTKDSGLVVLVAEDDRLRVMSMSDKTFGWIAADVVTTDKPSPDLDALLKQLGAQGGAGAGFGGLGGGE